jgi:hypothetical protein
MSIVFTKRHGFSSVDRSNPTPLGVLASLVRHSARSELRRPKLSIRMSAALMKQAGWIIGDRCIVTVDGRHWKLERTSDQKSGYRITKSGRSKQEPGYVKFAVTPDQVEEVGLAFGKYVELAVSRAAPDVIAAEAVLA